MWGCTAGGSTSAAEAGEGRAAGRAPGRLRAGAGPEVAAQPASPPTSSPAGRPHTLHARPGPRPRPRAAPASAAPAPGQRPRTPGLAARPVASAPRLPWCLPLWLTAGAPPRHGCGSHPPDQAARPCRRLPHRFQEHPRHRRWKAPAGQSVESPLEIFQDLQTSPELMTPERLAAAAFWVQQAGRRVSAQPLCQMASRRVCC